MSRARLIISVGTQEPRIRCGDEFLLLKDTLDPRVKRKVEERGTRAKGLYAAAKAVYDSRESQPAELRFPILQQALQFAREKCPSLDNVLLIATDAQPRSFETGPHLDDTYWSAMLASEVLGPCFPEVMFRIVPLRDERPHLYGRAKRLLREADLLNRLDDDASVLVCTSPGLPAVNQALVYSILHEHNGETVLFQVDEPGEAALKRGETGNTAESIADADMLADFVARQLRVLIKHHNYASAQAMVERLPKGPDTESEALSAFIKRAQRQWTLQFTSDLSSGRWDLHFIRAYGAIRVSEALFRNDEWDDAMAWIGDSTAFLQELMGAVATGDASIVDAPPKEKETKDWRRSAERFYNDLWKDILTVKGKCYAWRNDYTHRLQTKSRAEFESWLQENGFVGFDDLCAEIEQLVDAIARRSGILAPELLKEHAVPFSELNQCIDAEIVCSLETGG